MSETPRPLTIERLRALLDAYGAAAERWPDPEREAARQLLARSGAARTLRDDAADLDRLLDAAPAAAPSPRLSARVLAAVPRARTRARWRRTLAVAVPLAAAAAVTLWVALEHRPAPTASTPVVALGEYASPTDVLLLPYGVDVYATVPSIGCADSVLGCPDVSPAAKPYSGRIVTGSVRA